MLRANENSFSQHVARLDADRPPRNGGALEFADAALDFVHRSHTNYANSVGRDDLPVGLMHLVDEVVRDMGLVNVDPLIALTADVVYSTKPLTDDLTTAPWFEAGERYLGPTPIIINLPAADPANALLSPILIHEAGHSAVVLRDGLLQQVKSAVDKPRFNAVLRRELKKVRAIEGMREHWIIGCHRWWAEHLCDALALAISGPSFLFAFASACPPRSKMESLTDHPFAWDRVDFAIRQLEIMGWLPWLQETAPALLAWSQEQSESHPLRKDKGRQRFQREVSAKFRDVMINAALNLVAKPLTYDNSSQNVARTTSYLSQNIPAYGHEDLTPTAWEIVLGGWVAAIDRSVQTRASAAEARGPESVTVSDLPEAAADAYTSELVIKSIESEAIARLWKDSSPNG